MQETFIADKKPIRIEVHEPPASRTTASRTQGAPAILLLHGAGGKVGLWLDRLAPHLLSAGVALYAPHYFESTSTTYADLATIADGIHFPQWLDTVAAALHWVAGRPAVDPNRIALVGISLGSFLALSFAARNVAGARNPAAARDSMSQSAAGPAAVRCVVDLSGGLPEPYASAATSQFPPTLILHGEADTVVSVSYARDLDRLLTQLRVPHETRILPGEGHWFTAPAQMQLLLNLSNFLSRYLTA